jgi:hypothetical protein
MSSGKIILHIVTRIGILILLLGLMLLYWNFIYDPHKFCDQYQHRHTDGAMGVFFLEYLAVVFFYLAILIEIPFLKRKGKNILANLNLGFILISVFTVLGYIAFLNLNR